MEKGPAVIDISSDEEDSPDESINISKKRYHESLESVDSKTLSDSNDEISEVSCVKKSRILQNESDEDCFVLDDDPDKPVSVIDDKNNYSDGCSDLLIVGENGPLACRDYPHPRHLCIDFPFSSTSHEKHCKLCHCYVCDSPAPCNFWGFGLLTTDHCHASDIDKFWKSLRKIFKLTKKTTLKSPVKLSACRRQSTQSSRPSSQERNHLRPCLTSSLPLLQNNHLAGSSPLRGLRTLPVNRPPPRYFTYYQHLSGHHYPRMAHASSHQSSASRFHNQEALHRSQRTALTHPRVNSQSIRPEMWNNTNNFHRIHPSTFVADGFNVPSASSLYPAIRKPL